MVAVEITNYLKKIALAGMGHQWGHLRTYSAAYLSSS